MGVAEQHHRAVLAFISYAIGTRWRGVAISVPDPVTLNNLGGGLEAASELLIERFCELPVGPQTILTWK